VGLVLLVEQVTVT
jgi:hypothetical protein